MAINEKKPLFVRIAGERQPNLLPVTASAVGFDFNRDRLVFYHTASDDWTDLSPDGVDFVGSVYADNFFASGVVTASLGLSGSLTTLADGTSYLIAGAGIDITSASNGPVTISSLITQQPEYWQSNSQDVIFTTGSAQITGSLYAGSDAYLSGSLWQGDAVLATGLRSHAQGQNTWASGNYSHAEGYLTTGSGIASHAEGGESSAIGIYSHAEGFITTASSDYSHAEGRRSHASGTFSHAEGGETIAYGEGSHAEGGYTIAYGPTSHTEGFSTTTGNTAFAAHAEGAYTNANGAVSHAEGAYTLAEANASHAEGYLTTGSGLGSHAEGFQTVASGSYSHAGGVGTIASGSGQTAIGSYNIKGNDFSFFVIGDGTDDSNRSDILRVNPGVSAGVGRVEVSGTLVANLALSGSLTQLPDGTSYLIAGTGISITSESNGAVTIASTVVASPEYWFSSQNEAVYTTGSALFRGPGGTADSPSDLGTDLFFFVSGAVNSKDTATTGTAAFGGDLVVSGAAYFENTVIVGQLASPVVLDVFADSVFYSPAQFTSNVLLGVSAADSIQVTGSLDVSGSAVFMSGLSGSLTQLTDGTSYLIAGTNIGITTQSNGSVTINNTAAAYAPAGSQGQVQYYDGGNFGGSSLFTFTPAVGAVTASVFVATAVSASSVVSGSKIWGGEIEATKYVKIDSGFEYTSIPIGVTNSVYLFISGVNKALHFAHYNEIENQTAVTDITSYDGLLQTGLRWGGFLSAAPGATTFSIASGSGQIVRYHTFPYRDPDPFIKLVEWSNFVSQSLTYVTSSQFTYVAIDENGGILQQTVPYSIEGSGDVIFLGRVNHVNSTAENAIMLPETTYAQVASYVDFARAFGPLKVSGHTLAPSGSSLRVTKTGGDSFIKGGNYLYNQDRPSYITLAEDGDKPAPVFVYLYTSGTDLNTLTNAGLGFPAIDPNNYNASGTLTALPSGTFTNLRVLYQPRNPQGYLGVYYGPSYYSTLVEASNGLDNESFEEHPTSKLATILCGYITVRSGSTDLSNTSQAKILQAGLFRSSVGLTAVSAGGGGGGTPGGSDTQVQFNQGGTTFAGDAQFTFNSTTNVLTVGNVMVGGTGQLMGSGVTFDLLDSTVQTINFGGAATTIDVGSTAGTNTLFGATKMPQGLSGSLTHLTDGSSYLIAGENTQVVSGSNGAITISTPSYVFRKAIYLLG